MSPSPRPRRRRRWLAAIALVLIVLLASGYIVARVSFEGDALGDKIATNLNKRMRGRIEIGSIHWDPSALKKALTGGWVPLTFENVRVWDDCALNSGAGALDEVRQGDPNEDCTLDDQPDPDPASTRRPRKLLLQTEKITGEVDIHALMFGNHDFVIRNLWVHGGEVMIEQTREPYPLHAYDRTIVSILTAFYPRMKAGFRAGIYADAPGPIFDLRDIHIENLNATVHMTPNTSLGKMWGFGTTARIEGLNVDADRDNLKNTSYLYMDPVDPLVAKFYVRLEATAKQGVVRLWDDGPRESFRMPKPGEAYPPPGRKPHTNYEIPLADIKLNRLAQLPGEWPRRDFVANTLELDIEAKTVPCKHERWPVPDAKLGARMHVTGELYNYWDRPYDGSWNLKVDGKNLGQTVRTCINRDIGGDQLQGEITLTGPFVANPKIGLSMKNLDYDVELSSDEPPLNLTFVEVEGSIDMVNEQGSLDKTTALIRGGKEPGEVVVAATFGVSPFNARAHVEIVKPIDVARWLPDSLEPVGTLVQGRFTAVGDSEVAFALEDFDLSLGRSPTEKAVRAWKGRLFTKDQFDTVKLQKVRIEAGRTRASLDGTIDALHDFNCDPTKYCQGHDSCAPCSVTRLEIEGCAPDLGYWLRRFGLPAFVESACSSQSSPGAPIVITGPLTKPKMNVATELTGLPCVDKLSILDSQFDSASGVLDIRRMKTGALGGTLEGSGRIRTGETPVIEKLNVTGRKLDPQKICGLGTLVKGTIDAVDVELAGTIVKREPLDWLNLAKVHARADKLTVLGEKFTNIAMCVNRSDDGQKCRPRKDYLDADDLAQCEAGKKTGFCAVATATRDGGGIVDATVARLPATKKGTTTTPPRLTGTVAASGVPVAILEQLLTPAPAPVPGAKTPPKPPAAPFAAGGVASMTLHLEGSPEAPQATGAVQLLRTWVEGSFLGDMQIAVTPGSIRTPGGNMPGISFSGTALAGRLSVSGTLGTQAPFPVELTLGGRRIDLDVLLDLKKRLPLPIPMPMEAWVTGTVYVRHELRPVKPIEPVAWIELTELAGVVTHKGADGRLVPLTISAVDQDRARQPAVSLRVTPSSIDFACRDKTGARFDCTTKLAIGPQGGKAAGTIDFKGRVTPQEVAIQAVGKLDLAALEPVLKAQFSCISGTASVSASIQGNYKKPSYEAAMQINGIQLTPAGGDDTILEAQSGLIKLANGSLGFTNVKLRVRDTHRDPGNRETARPTTDASCAGRARATPRDEAGELFVKGNIELDGLTPKSWGVLIEGKLSGKMLGLLAKEYVSQATGLARIEGDLLLTGKGTRPTIAGTLVFDEPPPCSAPDAKPGDCTRANETSRSITVLPRLLRKEIALQRGRIEIETETINDVRSYKLSVLDDLVLKIGGEGTVTVIRGGQAELRDGNLAKLDVELDANALAFQQPGKLDLVIDAKRVRILRATDSSNLYIKGDLTIADGSFRQDFDILDNSIKALRSNAPPATPIWEASPLIGNAELDMTLDVRKFSLKSNITTIDMSGRLRLTETPRDPRLAGTIRIDGGNFKMPGMRARFTRTRGGVFFEEGSKAGNPELTITSEADYRDLSGQDHVITLAISQRVDNIKWDLTTSTGYNKSQTVALLLLGRNPEQLRRSLGDQILGSDINNIDPTTNPTQGFADQIVKDLAGDWVSDLLENSLTRITGLDVLRIEVGFGSIGLRIEKKLPGLENMNLIGTGEQTIRGNTLNVRAELKATYRISVQGGFLGKYFNDPAEQDITDYSGRMVFRILP